MYAGVLEPPNGSPPYDVLAPGSQAGVRCVEVNCEHVISRQNFKSERKLKVVLRLLIPKCRHMQFDFRQNMG